MRKSTTSRQNSIMVLALGLCLLIQRAWSDVQISRVLVDGQTNELTASSVNEDRELKPLRLSSSARQLQFFFTETDAEGHPTVRLRFKLDGYDDTWHDLPARMRVMVQFHDRVRRMVRADEFSLQGETPGWHGSVASSEFVARSEQVAVPAQAATAQIIFLSHGGESAIGLVALDNIRVEVKHPQANGLDVFDLSLRGANLSPPLGTPDNWTREASSRPDLAQLGIRPTPAPHPILILNDDDPNNYANWSLSPQQEIPVQTGDQLILDWQVAHSIGQSGPGEVSYPRLKAGRYWFRVAAATANGELNGQEVSLPVMVVAPFTQRWEFWLVMFAIAGVGLIWARHLILQRQMRQRLAESERQQELERERARIARDLHDDIGAGLTEIAMQSDWVRRDLATTAHPDALRRIERVRQSAEELTRSVDEMVWAVTPANDTLDRFANYLTQSAKQFLDASNLRVRFDLPAELPPATLPGKVRHCLFLAVREALNNVTKHAHAGLVRLELKLDAEQLRIVIADDGCGFAPEALAADGTHEGLNTMRRRVEEIGGEFHLASRRGKGTRIELVAPLSAKS
jgi:signal transduction histidine kinase